MISIEEKKRERERNRNDDWRENNRDNFTSGLIRLCLIVEQQFFLAIVKLENKSERFYISFVPYHVLFNFHSRFFESRMVRKLKKKKKRKTLEIICTPVSNLADYYWIFIQIRIPDI